MTKDNEQDEARAPAVSPYALFVFLDETTDGDTIYVATNPELPGCVAQGDTVEEAVEILAEVREDYIAHRIANNLPVQPPVAARSFERQMDDLPFVYRIVEPESERDDRLADVNLQVMQVAAAA